jgi:hypothetical protein
MTIWHGLTPALLGWAITLVPQPSKDALCLDLQGHANQKLDQTFHGAADQGNHLGQLPAGKQEMDGVIFEIGGSLIQLGSTYLKDKPDAVTGIPVNRAFERLHILQASGCSGSEENTVIGLYVIHYDDKTRESFEIVFGQDVYDWWYSEEERELTRSKVAWRGDNDSARASNKKIRLYHTTWRNPHPNKKVVGIDILASEGSTSAPFCVAMTVE